MRTFDRIRAYFSYFYTALPGRACLIVPVSVEAAMLRQPEVVGVRVVVRWMTRVDAAVLRQPRVDGCVVVRWMTRVEASMLRQPEVG